MVTTPKEFKERMREIYDTIGGDPASAHSRMDRLMMKVLDELGYHEGVVIFELQDKWYS